LAALDIRRHNAEGRASEAVYSPCTLYRYSLTRIRAQRGPRLLFVMLNPSTASELANDPTVARCESRAWHLGYAAFRVVNLFAFRATDPRALRHAADPVGPLTDVLLEDSAFWADAVLCAWGNHGQLQGRAAAVLALLRRTGRPLLHLGLTLQGHPRHPLYTAMATPPFVWESAAPVDQAASS
jgi:hypothetical protein